MTDLDQQIEQLAESPQQASTEPGAHATESLIVAPKVLVETWGCQMNVADSEQIISALTKQGYQTTQDENAADLFVLNTCHIREKAKQKVLSRLGKLRELKTQNPNIRIAVAGCVAQAEGIKLVRAAPQIDVLIGPGKIDQLSVLLKQQEESGKHQIATGFEREHKTEDPTNLDAIKPTVTGKNEVSRYVTIAQGCDNFCTFCVVPFTRGREISRLPEDITRECRALVASGVREITLLGQNVNSYGNDLLRSEILTNSQNKSPFVELLRSVAAIPGLDRLRFTTSNPHDFTEDLANLFANEKKLGKYMHLPVQSGSDRILDLMKRKVTVQEYMERVQWLRTRIEDFALSTDLIVGFPGESREDFEGTLKLVEQVRYSFIFAFMYSSRKNTAAARFKDQISEAEKKSRLAELNALQGQITLAQNEAEVGKVREVMFLYQSAKRPGSYYGRTEQLRLCCVKSESRNLVGQLAKVKITEANKTAISGELI